MLISMSRSRDTDDYGWMLIMIVYKIIWYHHYYSCFSLFKCILFWIYFIVISGFGLYMPHTLWLQFFWPFFQLFKRRVMFLNFKVYKQIFCSSWLIKLNSFAFLHNRFQACSPITSMLQLPVQSAKVTEMAWVMIVYTIFLQ